MSEENSKTIQAYEAHCADYIRNTPRMVCAEVRSWIDECLQGLAQNAKIFEIGSGDGRDAHYIETRGYKVECSDAAQPFVTHLLENGFLAQQHDAIRDPIMASYDLIYANAVLHHMTEDDANTLIKNVYPSLKLRGRFAFSVKAGAGASWVMNKMNAPRYTRLWSRQDVEKFLKNAGFHSWDIKSDVSPLQQKEGWIQVIAYK